MINNKLLEICKSEPNNLKQQYWTCIKKKSVQEQSRYTNCKRTKAREKKVCNHANRNNFNLEENKETLEELRMSSFRELKSLGPWNRIENLPMFVLQYGKQKQDFDLVL